MRHIHIRTLADLDVWMSASPMPERQALALALRPRVNAAHGDLSALMLGLASELVSAMRGGAQTDDSLAQDAGDTASSLLLEVLSVINLRGEAVRAPGVLDALVAALDSPQPMLQYRSLASLASTVITVRDDLVARGLLPKLLAMLDSDDAKAALEADTILFCTVGAYTPHHAAFVEAGGPDILRRLLREGRPWVSDQWRGILAELHGAGTTYTAFYSLDDGGWFVEVPELRGCHSQGGTIDEARARIREAVNMCLPGSDQAEILDVLKPSQGAALTPPTCSYCGATVALVHRTRRCRRGDRIVRVQSGSWECKDCRDPFTGKRPFQFSDVRLMEAADADARWGWHAVYGEALPASARVPKPGAARRVARRVEATLASDAPERALAPGCGAPDQVVIHALWGADGLLVTFADGLHARIPKADVMRGQESRPSALKLAGRGPFGLAIRYGRGAFEVLPWEWLRGFGQLAG